jgi:acetyl-CoA carboxylase biotin carboxyl carrier protein
MKVMNPIPAPKSGVVKRILVEDSQPIEYNEVMMLIE